MSDTRTVQILGGSHDGAEYALPPAQRDLRVPRLGCAVLLRDADAGEAVPYAIDVYGPATEADEMLNRWSLLRTEYFR